MLVQTCTKEKPTSVLAHRAGGWNYAPVPPIVYIGFALVSNSSCPMSVASHIPSPAVLALLSYSLFLGSHAG
ncbi:MAG: hypothetical protein SXV54_06450 [Chloroflexota bacterium]|nr:hypothetical protein [Chloroflexota bacterium]